MLDLREKILIRCLKDTVWMARRYANLRSTYAPGVINKVIDELISLDVNIESDKTLGMYAQDGTFGKWVPEKQCFEKETIKEKSV